MSTSARLADVPEEALAAPAPAREKLAWGFPIGCAIFAAAIFVLARAVAPPVPPPEAADFYAVTPLPYTAVDLEEPLPMPFLSPFVITRTSFAKPLPDTRPSSRLHAGAITVSGRLPPEVVTRILRMNHARFRRCYADGLRNDPSLQGRVTTRFIIGRDGSVSIAENGGSDLPDGGVVQCVVRAMHDLSFPRPDRGVVSVVYPIRFTPT